MEKTSKDVKESNQEFDYLQIPDYSANDEDWIIDTDPGIDDAFAITLALNYVKENLKLISIQAGNVGLNKCIQNGKKICALNKRKIDISNGQSLFLSCAKIPPVERVHGSDGFVDLTDFSEFDKKYDSNGDFPEDQKSRTHLPRHSAVEIIELCNKYENADQNSKKKINIMAIGPLTNLALAYMLDPSIVDKFSKVLLMGGSYNSRGNYSPCGEFNFAADNLAAKVFLDKFKRVIVYCWEPSENFLVLPKDLKLDQSKYSEKMNFLKQAVNKKSSGIYADYGAAVAAFYPSSVLKSKIFYSDISIDGTERKQSLFMLSETNIFNNKKKEKVEVIYDMDMRIFHGLFNKMMN